MTIFEFAATYILFLIPGVIFLSLFCYLSGKHLTYDLLNILYLIIASILSYLLGDLFLLFLNFLPVFNFSLVDIGKILSGNLSSISNIGLLFAIIASVLFSFLALFIWDRNILFKFAITKKITHRKDNESVWDYMFDDQSTIIVRDYVSGNIYYGVVTGYSDGTSSIRELMLEDVNVYKNGDKKYHMERIYLSRKPSEFSIEFDKYIEEVVKDGRTNEKTDSNRKQQEQDTDTDEKASYAIETKES